MNHLGPDMEIGLREGFPGLLNKVRYYREACQFLAIFQSADRIYFAGGALGQLDELLRPFYEADIKAGTLTNEEVVWILASLFYNDTHWRRGAGRVFPCLRA